MALLSLKSWNAFHFPLATALVPKMTSSEPGAQRNTVEKSLIWVNSSFHSRETSGPVREGIYLKYCSLSGAELSLTCWSPGLPFPATSPIL